jgi:multidrug efflux pump subunit AcrB
LAKARPLPAGVYSSSRTVNSVAELWRPLLQAYGLGLFVLLAFLTLAFDLRTAGVAIFAAAFGWLGAIVAIAVLGGVVTVGTTAALLAVFAFSLRGAILLISRVEDRVLEHGVTWSFAAVAHATRERAGPLITTALLLAAALLPLALSINSPGHEILATMAIVIICGALSGVIANLTLLPLLAWRFWRPGASMPETAHI